MTVNSMTSVSLDPPLLLVCLARDARTTMAVGERGAFAISILHARQDVLANRFAQPGEDHFAGLEPRTDELGLPTVPGCAAVLSCSVETTYPGGDHVIVVGRVVGCERREASPLIFLDGRYHAPSGPGRQAENWYW